MPQFYKPNKSNKGHAASFSYSVKDDAVFASILRQHSYNEETQNGSFKESKNYPNAHVNIKLSFEEVGGFIDCIERGREVSKYHDNDETPKQISFRPWKDGEIQKGYSFSVTVTSKNDASFKNSFFIGLNLAEGRYLREFLVHSLHAHFTKVNSRQNEA